MIKLKAFAVKAINFLRWVCWDYFKARSNWKADYPNHYFDYERFGTTHPMVFKPKLLKPYKWITI